MATDFDPYHRWLGIAPGENRNYYRLLGLPLFESDPRVIEAGADRQMGFVKNHASGPHIKLSQQILNELAVAKVCLLNPEGKAAYDAELAQQQDVPIERTAAAANDIELTPIAVAQVSNRAVSLRRSPKRAKKLGLGYKLSGACLAALTLLIIMLYVAGPKKARENQVGRGDNDNKSIAKAPLREGANLPDNQVPAPTPFSRPIQPSPKLHQPTSLGPTPIELEDRDPSVQDTAPLDGGGPTGGDHVGGTNGNTDGDRDITASQELRPEAVALQQLEVAKVRAAQGSGQGVVDAFLSINGMIIKFGWNQPEANRWRNDVFRGFRAALVDADETTKNEELEIIARTCADIATEGRPENNDVLYQFKKIGLVMGSSELMDFSLRYAADPNDPMANLKLGMHYCFDEPDKWNRGFAMFFPYVSRPIWSRNHHLAS